MTIFHKVGILSVLTAISFATNAEAQLILNINTAAETFSLSGSDTGTPVKAGATSIYNLSWELGVDPGVAESLSLTSGLNVTGPVSPEEYLSASIAATNGNRLTFNLVFRNTSQPPTFSAVNFSGNGNSFSYAGWDVANKTFISTLTNSNILIPNVGVDTQNVQISVIPEPSSAALIGLTALGYGLLRRRRVVNK